MTETDAARGVGDAAQLSSDPIWKEAQAAFEAALGDKRDQIGMMDWSTWKHWFFKGYAARRAISWAARGAWCMVCGRTLAAGQEHQRYCWVTGLEAALRDTPPATSVREESAVD